MMKCTDPSIVLSYLGYPFPTMHSAVTCSCSKSFGETTHNTEPCKAHRSPNDFEQRDSDPLWHSSLFLTYNVRMRIAILRTFSS